MKKTVPFQLYKAAFDRSPTLLAILDERFNLVHVNQSYANHSRREPNELLGRNHFDLYPDSENEAIFRRVLETGQEYSVSAKPFDHPDQQERGITFWDWTLVPIDDEGKPYLLLMIADVTDEVALKRELQYNYDTLLSLFENTVVGVVRTDRDFRYLFANRAYHEIFGTVPEKCTGRTLGEVVHVEKLCDQWRRYNTEVFTSGSPVTFEFEYPPDVEDNRSYQADLTPEFDAEGNVRSVLTLITDVSHIKDRKDELETLLVEMNHRIKNNLANVEALARVELFAPQKGKEEAIDDIISRVHAIGQVHQTLYETKSFATVQIATYLRELLDSLVEGGRSGTCRIVPRFESEEVELSSKIATKLGLMLAELTTNTMKYAGCRESLEIVLRLRREKDDLVITYYDTGRGFGPDVSSFDDIPTGTGVMILQALLADLGGSISLDTTTKPAVFVIRVPL